MARIHPIHHLHPGGHVAAILECPICHEMNIPPIYPCTLGHNICLNCKEQGENCPLCGGVYINCRNGYLEKLLDNCRISCKYGGLGCEAIYVHGGQVQEHELECEFGPIHCLECNRLLKYNEFMTHLKEEKNMTTVVPGSGYRTAFDLDQMGIDEDSVDDEHIWKAAWLNCLGTDFFLRMESDGDGEDCWIFVNAYGTKAEVSQWSCEIVAFNTKKKMSVSYNGPVNSIRARGKDAADFGYCLRLGEDGLEAFMNDNKELEVRVKLFRGPRPSQSGGILPAPMEATYRRSGEMSTEPLRTDAMYRAPDLTYQNIAIPLVAIVSVPNTRSSDGTEGQGRNPNGATGSGAAPTGGVQSVGVDMGSHGQHPMHSPGYFTSNPEVPTGGDGDDPPPTDSSGSVLGTRLGRLVSRIQAPFLAELVMPTPEINLYDFGEPLPMLNQDPNHGAQPPFPTTGFGPQGQPVLTGPWGTIHFTPITGNRFDPRGPPRFPAPNPANITSNEYSQEQYRQDGGGQGRTDYVTVLQEHYRQAGGGQGRHIPNAGRPSYVGIPQYQPPPRFLAPNIANTNGNGYSQEQYRQDGGAQGRSNPTTRQSYMGIPQNQPPPRFPAPNTANTNSNGYSQGQYRQDGGGQGRQNE